MDPQITTFQVVITWLVVITTNQSKTGLIFALFPLVVNEILVEESQLFQANGNP